MKKIKAWHIKKNSLTILYSDGTIRNIRVGE